MKSSFYLLYPPINPFTFYLLQVPIGPLDTETSAAIPEPLKGDSSRVLLPGLGVPSTSVFHGQKLISAFVVGVCDAIAQHSTKAAASTLVLVVPSLRNAAEVIVIVCMIVISAFNSRIHLHRVNLFCFSTKYFFF